jgi:antitoxin ParD1/3/4
MDLGLVASFPGVERGEMNVSLTPELERYVNDKIEGGTYHSASEVVREGLRLLKERDEMHERKLAALRADIQIAVEQAERGQVSPFNEETLRAVKAQGLERLNARKANGA